MSSSIYNNNRAELPLRVKLIEDKDGRWYWVDDIEIPNGPFETKQQAVQAAWADQDLDLYGGEKGCMVYTYDGLEKFARLIVQECASVAVQDDEPDLSGNPYMDLNGAYMAGKGSASLMIQEHFGIEGFEE